MKPSQRIKEIAANLGRESDMGTITYGHIERIEAIIQYLDEEWENNQPCKHLDSYIVESSLGDSVYYNVCNTCGVLFLVHKDL